MEKFEFIFENDNLEWHYESFCRMTDGMIREEKNNVEELLSYGFDKLLLNIVESEFDKNDDMVVVQFELEERQVGDRIPLELKLGEAIGFKNAKYNMRDIKNIKVGHRRLKV